MVGTHAVTKYVKVNINKGELKSSPLEECQNIDQVRTPQDTEFTHNIQERNSFISLPHGSPSSHNHRRISYGTFGTFYFIAGFSLFIISTLALTCALRKVMISYHALNPNSISHGVTVMVFDGRKESISWPEPPPYQDLAAVARYVLHISEWGSLSTNSTHEGIEGYPFVNVFSVSDGPVDNSTGVPYFYFTPLELSVKDMEVNSKVSFTVSEAQSDYCNRKRYDPEDPRCAHIIFSGSIKKLAKGSKEEEFAQNALFSRHEEMKGWPVEHRWFFAKLDIVHIYVLDFFGGVGVVPIEDYFATNPFKN